MQNNFFLLFKKHMPKEGNTFLRQITSSTLMKCSNGKPHMSKNYKRPVEDLSSTVPTRIFMEWDRA